MGIIFIVIYGIFIILGDIYPYKYQRGWADDLGHLVACRAAARKGVAGYAREEGGGDPYGSYWRCPGAGPDPPTPTYTWREIKKVPPRSAFRP